MQRSFMFKRSDENRKSGPIRKEIKEIELEFNNDVFAVRNEIEKATLRFSEAQRRYRQVEKDYNDALLEFVKSKEEKELLTTKLTSIIQLKETKRSQKLSQMIEKLEISSRQK